jgi:diadenosine tetraphosphate (Ap4A) HIT family hydrolase
VLWQNDLCRVVAVEDADYPGFVRVIANRHVREMTDLSGPERRALMDVVLAVESAMRETMQPDKMNLASLGNMTPHVHWHVIPRFGDDRHFPGPVWSAPKRAPVVPAERLERAGRLGAAIAARLREA